MLYETKPALGSKTVISSLVVLLAAVAGVFDYTISAHAQQELSSLVLSVITAVGGIGAIYGRVTATKEIKGTVATPKEFNPE